METLEQRIRKNAAQSGIIFGIIFFIVSIFNFYYITTMAKSYVTILVVPIVIILVILVVGAILFINNLRKKIGGYWNFRQATTGIFILFFVCYFLSFLGNLAFNKIIEPDMLNKMETVMVNSTQTMMESQHLSQDKIDEGVAKTEKGFEDQKNRTVVQYITSFGIAILMIFILALIFAAFYKKEKPLYDLPVDEIDPTSAV